MPPPAVISPAFEAEGAKAPAVLPFRRRDESLFWCQVQTQRIDWLGKAWTMASLQPAVAPQQVSRVAPVVAARASVTGLMECLPCAAVLTDRNGRILASNVVARESGLAAVPLFRAAFALPSAAVLEHLIRDGAQGEQRFGRLVLTGSDENDGREWVAYWLLIPSGPALAQGGHLFVLAEDWETICPPDDLAAEWRRAVARPAADWVALLLRDGQETAWWDERWEKLTGLKAADLAGVPGEVVLDWLFPHQSDRDFVADLLHQPLTRAGGAQAMLHVLSAGGSRPLLCTFLPVARGARVPPTGQPDTWLLLIGEPQASPLSAADAAGPAARHVRQFARGLSHLLNHYLTTPIGVAEMALDRNDLPAPVVTWFGQILESCRHATYLVSALQDLAAVEVGETALESLAAVVREVLNERATGTQRAYDLTASLPDQGMQVRVNPRMVRVVLRHLLNNAEQAIVNSPRRHIAVRVNSRAEGICCEIEDSGEGLSIADWTAALAPFYSTKGPFARDAVHAALPGTGLGLTVSQHLLALHGGRLVLDSRPGEGTTAVVILPHAFPASTHPPDSQSVRLDRPAEARGPHAAPGVSSAVEPAE
jgi:signal transduction histidine kinase